MATILVDRAGPSGAPAVVMHPDTSLPKTWRVVDQWTYRRQSGAWLERINTGQWQYGRPETPMLAQVVYRTTAKPTASSQVGHALKYASRGLVCTPLDLHWATCPKELDYREAAGSAAQSEADKVARAQYLGISVDDLHTHDKAALDRYVADVRAEALKADPLGLKHTDNALIEGWAEWVVWRCHLLDADIDSAMIRYDTAMSPNAQAWGATIRPMVEARARAKLAKRRTPQPAPATPSPSTPASAPEPSQVPVEAPPEPGMGRAEWLGQRVTELMGYCDRGRAPHTRRRIAARYALARVAGYDPSDAENDALYIASASLSLAGLNEYARRVLDNGEVPTIGGTNALL